MSKNTTFRLTFIRKQSFYYNIFSCTPKYMLHLFLYSSFSSISHQRTTPTQLAATAQHRQRPTPQPCTIGSSFIHNQDSISASYACVTMIHLRCNPLQSRLISLIRTNTLKCPVRSMMWRATPSSPDLDPRTKHCSHVTGETLQPFIVSATSIKHLFLPPE